MSGSPRVDDRVVTRVSLPAADFNSKDIIQDMNRLLKLEEGGNSSSLRKTFTHALVGLQRYCCSIVL